MPGGVYGPGDHSEVGSLIEQLRTGKLRMRTFPEMGMNLAHVDDIAAGIVLVFDRGTLGESYVIGGEITRLGDVLDVVGRLVRPARPAVHDAGLDDEGRRPRRAAHREGDGDGARTCAS